LRVREARYWKGRCFPLRSKVETTTMHDAMVTLLFMVIAMFPFLLSLQTPE
jgi:nitrate reductase NapE component